jgi:hypothetical protein
VPIGTRPAPRSLIGTRPPARKIVTNPNHSRSCLTGLFRALVLTGRATGHRRPGTATGDNIIDGLVIATLQRLLTEASIDMADLVDADTASTVVGTAAGAA